MSKSPNKAAKRFPGRPKLAPEARVVRLSCYVQPDVAKRAESRAVDAGFERLGPWLSRLVLEATK